MADRIWVIIPTYNEIDNLPGIVEAVDTELRQTVPGDYRILIVDDDSPDGTGRLADQLTQSLDCVEVLHRPDKDGLGRAYIAGFARALEGGAELLIQMDADFSHHPRYLKDLLAAAETADMAIGSRYAPGGGVEN